MAMTTSYDMAHRFFHDPSARGEYARINSSIRYSENDKGEYTNWQYVSYSTVVAEMRKDKFGENILIISDYKYSNTTAKQLRELENANPHYVAIYVPVAAYSWRCPLSGTYGFKTQLQQVADMTEKDLNRAENREFVKHTLCMYDIYVSHFKDMDKESKKLRKSAKVRKALEIACKKDAELAARRNHVATPEELAKREAERAKIAERLERKIAEFLGEGVSLDKLKAVYSGIQYYRRGYHYAYNNVTSKEMRECMTQYRKMLDSKRDEQGRTLSYVWLDEHGAYTSRHCSAPLEDVKRLCSLWKRHQSIIGDKAGSYTILENTADYVKIGCHVIPAWNIELLCEKLNIA